MNESVSAATLSFSEKFDVRYGYYAMCGTILFFQILNKTFTFLGPPKSIQKNDIWRWRNLFISWIHAFITGTLSLYCIHAYPDLLRDPLGFVDPISYFTVAFTTGYFLYDIGDMIVNNELLSNWEVTLHHIAVTTMAFYNTATCSCIGYNILALLAEVNSFFLHSRKLMQMLQVDFNALIYRVNAVTNLATFAVFRSLSLGCIINGMLCVSERQRVSTLYFITLTSSHIVLLLINPMLFWRLLKNDILRPLNAKREKGNSIDNSNNNCKKSD